MSVVLSYAQNREDIYINWLLAGKKNGFYIDVGANDPIIDSVTKFFYDKGWHGINIEPIQHHYVALEKARPKDTNLNIGISNEAGQLVFREYVNADGLSTLSPETKKEQEKLHRKVLDYSIEAKPLSEVLEAYVPKGEVIDFLKIDVEGYEDVVIKSNDWKRFHPRLVIAEASHVKHDWRPLLKASGYSLVFADGVNEYYGDKALAAIDHSATYPELVIGPTFLDIKQQEHMIWLENEERGIAAEHRRRLVADFTKQIYDINSQVVALENQSFMRYLRRSLKRQHVRIRGKLLRLKAGPISQRSGSIPDSRGNRTRSVASEAELTSLKQEDVNRFVPKIETREPLLSWRKLFYGSMLALYDTIVAFAKATIRFMRGRK